METRSATNRPLQQQSYFIIFGRLTLIVVNALPFLVTYASLTNDNDRFLFNLILTLFGAGAAMSILFFALLNTRWSYLSIYISIIYDSFIIMLAAHILGSVIGPYPLLLATTIVSAGTQLRARPRHFWIFIAYIIALYLVFSFIELRAMSGAGSGMSDMALNMGLVKVSNDSWHYLVPLFYGVALLQTALILWANNLRVNILFRRVEQQALELAAANAALSRSSDEQGRLAAQLQQAAVELSDGAYSQASSASQQAAAIMEVSVTVEELNQAAQQIAEAAASVAHAAGQTMTSATRGQDAVRDSIIGMTIIKQRVNDITNRILALSERSQRISEIVDIINNIAGETHLLALNAAIESAGAGEEGLRFGVVSSEVKKLSQRVVLAVRDVRQVISELQAATNAAVMATEDGMKETDKGVNLAHTSGDANEDIIQMVGRTTQLASAISLATQQQHTASEQVNYTIRDVAALSHTAMEISQRASSAAAQVRAIASQLASADGASSANGHSNGSTPASDPSPNAAIQPTAAT